MTDPWQDTPEDDGITLGPEEALEREIARSKALKVERLQLRDRVERLTAQNRALQAENEMLKQRGQARSGISEYSPPEAQKGGSGVSRGLFPPSRSAFILLVFNLAALGILLYFLLQGLAPWTV